MNPDESNSSPNSSPREGAGASLFGDRGAQKAPFSPLPWLIAGVVIVVLGALALFAGRHHAGGAEHGLAKDDYAPKLVLSGLQMSESTSLSGGKSTFIDGTVRNAGEETVVNVSLQVSFANDESLPAQSVTLPLTMIRSREPYVDTVPLAAAPLAPGSEREFRLIFEDIGANWNQQLPVIQVKHVFVACKACR